MTVPICTPPRDSSVALPVFIAATVFNRGCAGKQVVNFTVSFCLFLADGHWHAFPSVYWPFGNTYFSIMLLHVLVLSNRLLYVLAMGVWLITYVCISLHSLPDPPSFDEQKVSSLVPTVTIFFVYD